MEWLGGTITSPHFFLPHIRSEFSLQSLQKLFKHVISLPSLPSSYPSLYLIYPLSHSPVQVRPALPISFSSPYPSSLSSLPCTGQTHPSSKLHLSLPSSPKHTTADCAWKNYILFQLLDFSSDFMNWDLTSCGSTQ